jgi:hypothetical protein
MASPKPILTSNGVYRKVGGVKKAPHALVGQKIKTNSNPVKPKNVTPAIKVVNEKITVNPQSVKVVPSTPDIHRKALNAMENTRTTITKSGALANREAARVAMRNGSTKATVVPVRSNAGITGAGAANVGKLYRGGGIGMFGLPKNK